jgi:hypothetical protein
MSGVTTVEISVIGEMLVLISMDLIFSANMDLTGLSRPLKRSFIRRIFSVR